MISPDNTDGGDYAPIQFGMPVTACVPDEFYAENVRSALSRNLPLVEPRKPHSHVMSIAAGGPSLEDTYTELKGVICAVNGSLSFLMAKGVKPWAVGVMDPRAHMAEVVERVPGVFYFLASTCHPRLFDKLSGLDIGLWHPSGMRGIETLVPETAYLVGGGTTMGLRWLNLGHFMGFREFHAHGLDSSFRGTSTHAYPDHTDGDEAVFTVKGYRTRKNFVQQIADWTETKAMFARMPVEDHPRIKLYGDGLLQYCEREGVC